jgi:hypothetical protein
MSDSEDNVQTAICKLNKIITEYGLTISTDKSKVMAFKGRDPTRTKIVIINNIIEQVNMFNYLGNVVSYEKEKDIVNKITTFLKITGLINNKFKPNEVQKVTRMKLYTTLALTILLYGSETWTVK